MEPMPKRHKYTSSSWDRPSGYGDRARLKSLRSLLQGAVADRSDDEPAVTVGRLREWLDELEPVETERVAILHDEERGVTYRVTLDPTPFSVGLRRVEVEVEPGNNDPGVFRIPVKQLRAQAEALHKWEKLHTSDDGTGRGFIRKGVVTPERPTPEVLVELIRAKMTRREIADRYGRTPDRVEQWIREGRRKRPDLAWPVPARGPKPKDNQESGGDRNGR